MARRKGKSQRRVKDWTRRYREEDLSSLDADQTETLQPPRVKLPAFRSEQAPDESEVAGRPRAEGMVTGLLPGGAYVRIGGQDLPCSLAGTFRPPEGTSALAVGDRVTVALAADRHLSTDKNADKQRADGLIVSRQIRQTALARPQPMSGKRRGQQDEELFEKVLAANMEILLIVASMRQPPLRPGLIDRFCIAAERGRMRPIVVINKIDLTQPDAALLRDLAARDIPAFCCSALRKTGLAELLQALQAHSSVLAGASGVGKSTLINALVPEADLPTRTIRMKDQRGRHVTAAVTLHELPAGGMIADTPGVRELAVEMQETELPWYFPELSALAGKCRFNNCTHTHEPGCAVRSAVEAGEIPAHRYDSYLRIRETI